MRADSEEFHALCSIIHYYQLRKSPNRINRTVLAAQIGVDKKFLDNFCAGTSVDQRSPEITKVLSHFCQWLHTDDGYEKCPHFIQTAADIVYKDFGSDRIDNILRRLSDRSNDTIDGFNRIQVGRYDVLRYSAHQDSAYQPVTDADGNPHYWVTHAALELFSASHNRYPRFKILYRSGKRGGRPVEPNTVEGEVIIIKNHMYFFGIEYVTRYPLVIVAQYNAQQSSQFRGIVIRNNFQFGSMFASRVLFVKNNASSIDDMKDDIYIELDTAVQSIVAFAPDELRNIGYNGGYGGIIL